MEITPFLSVSLLLCCAFSSTAFAQQTQSLETTNPPSVMSPAPSGEALRRRLLNPTVEPFKKRFGEEMPVIRIETYTFAPRHPDAGHQTWGAFKGLTNLYAVALDQRKRFRETAQPIAIERNGIYFRRDLYSTTKGLILRSFFDDRIDIGLYKRRFQASAAVHTGQPVWCGTDGAGHKSFALSGGRQIFVGVRFKLDRIF